jgi:hypothetical protein
MFIKTTGALRKAVSCMRDGIARLKEATSLSSAGDTQAPVATSPRQTSPIISQFGHQTDYADLPQSPAMREILAGRVDLLEQVGWSAQQGVVGDGLPRRLQANHEAELAEHCRLLTQDKLTLQAGQRLLAGMFPKPPEPEPTPAPPRRQRSYPPLTDLLAARPKARPN